MNVLNATELYILKWLILLCELHFNKCFFKNGLDFLPLT